MAGLFFDGAVVLRGHEEAEGVFNHEKHEIHERHEMTMAGNSLNHECTPMHTNAHQCTPMHTNAHEGAERVFNHEKHEKHERDTEVGVSVEQNA